VHTDGDRLDLNAFFNMSAVGVIRLLVRKDGLAAERVHEGGSACKAHRRQLAPKKTRVNATRPADEATRTSS
jgi:hypothetical protein